MLPCGLRSEAANSAVWLRVDTNRLVNVTRRPSCLLLLPLPSNTTVYYGICNEKEAGSSEIGCGAGPGPELITLLEKSSCYMMC